MKHLLLATLIAATAIVFTSCVVDRGRSVDDLIARNVMARGGAAALDAITTVRTVVEITEPTFTVVGDYRATTSGRMRIDVFAKDVRVFSEGIDRAGAWQRRGGDAQVTPSSDAGRAALLHGIEFNLFGLHRFAARGHTVTLEGRDRVDDVDYDVLQVTLQDGHQTWLYLDPHTGQIARQRDVSALHPDVNPDAHAAETVSEDFTTYCGVGVAARSRHIDLTSGATVQTTRILSQECNVPEEALGIPREEPAGLPAMVRK